MPRGRRTSRARISRPRPALRQAGRRVRGASCLPWALLTGPPLQHWLPPSEQEGEAEKSKSFPSRVPTRAWVGSTAALPPGLCSPESALTAALLPAPSRRYLSPAPDLNQTDAGPDLLLLLHLSIRYGAQGQRRCLMRCALKRSSQTQFLEAAQ